MELWNLLRGAAQSNPTGVAAREGDRSWTWAQMHDETAAFAAGLSARGIAPGDRVTILERNSVAYLQAYFALAGLGAIAVPLNVRLANPELASILQDAAPKAWLVGADFDPQVDALRGEVPALELVVRLSGAGEDASLADLVFLRSQWIEYSQHGDNFVPWLSIIDVLMFNAKDEVKDMLSLADLVNERRTFQPHESAAGDVAQLYYTSGTTGRPKGVMLTHGNVAAHAAAACTELDLFRDDVWGHFAPMFHLADAWAVFAITREAGAHAFLPRFSTSAALDVLRRDGVTLTNLVPTMLQALLADLDGQDARTPSLRLILSGGAPIAPSVVGRTLDTFGCEYAQTYGLTETSPFLTLSLLQANHLRLTPEQQLAVRSRTGRPYETVELEIVDRANQLVPQDDRAVGEIRVRGTTVSPGYWQRPEVTAAAFRDGWFYTGDLATWNQERSVNIVDRAKDVILTGGENVYSTEVEAALLEHRAVLECAAYGVPHPEWGEELRIAVMLRPGDSATEDELRDHCRERLANYKVPKRVELVDELPRTGSGKVQKRVLRDRAAR